MKKLLITLILLGAASGGTYVYYNKYVKVEDKASVSQSPVSSGSIVQQVQATGTLEAQRTVAVGAQVSGVVKALYVDFNSMVKEGQLLAELDPALLQVQVDIQNANIGRQVGDIEQQKVQLENDKLNLTRTETQASKGLVSVQALETARLQVKSREAQIASADKQLVQARASLAQAELNVKYTKIVSPIDGVVVDRRVDVGQTVQSSVNVATFFSIATDLTTLKLSAGIDEAEIGFIRPNMPVTFTVDSYGTRPFHGNVDAVRLNATTAQNVVTYPVWITVQNPDYKLRPSMTANLRIVVDRADNVLRVPNQALRFNPTSDIYTWLGMPAPAPGQGRGRGVNANAAPGAPGAPGPPAAGDAAAAPGGRPGQAPQANAEALGAGAGRRQRDPNAAPGQGGQGGFGQGQTGQDPQANAGAGGGRRQRDPNAQMAQGGGVGGGQNPGGGRGGDPAQGGRGGGRGFGGGMQNLTPEQIAQFRANGGGRGGGRGGDPTQGGRGGGRGGRAVGNDTGAAPTPLSERSATKIDELFEPIVKPDTNGRIWIYNEKAADPKDKLKAITVRLGLTDTTFSQLISGEGLAAGTMVVTSVVPPPSVIQQQRQNPSNIFNQNQRGGQQPFGGGGPGGPGGGGAGGGGRGGGGGGGRGGN